MHRETSCRWLHVVPATAPRPERIPPAQAAGAGMGSAGAPQKEGPPGTGDPGGSGFPTCQGVHHTPGDRLQRQDMPGDLQLVTELGPPHHLPLQHCGAARDSGAPESPSETSHRRPCSASSLHHHRYGDRAGPSCSLFLGHRSAPRHQDSFASERLRTGLSSPGSRPPPCAGEAQSRVLAQDEPSRSIHRCPLPALSPGRNLLCLSHPPCSVHTDTVQRSRHTRSPTATSSAPASSGLSSEPPPSPVRIAGRPQVPPGQPGAAGRSREHSCHFIQPSSRGLTRG